MTTVTFDRKEFEVTLIPGTSNPLYLTVDFLNADNTVGDPFDGGRFERFYAQACAVPQEDDRNPVPLLRFTVVHLDGFIPEGEASPHPGAFFLICDPTASRVLQDQWVLSGIIDIIGVQRSGIAEYVARGNFNTLPVATRELL